MKEHAGNIDASESSPSTSCQWKNFEKSVRYLEIFKAFIIPGISCYLSFIKSPPRNLIARSCLEIDCSCAVPSKRVSYTLTLFWLAESIQWIFEISARDVITEDSPHLGRKYARIFVLGHYLFLEAHSFPRASLSENCSHPQCKNLSHSTVT